MILPLKMEKTPRKVYKKVEIKLELCKSILIRFDDRKWSGVPKIENTEDLNCEWTVTLPDGKTTETIPRNKIFVWIKKYVAQCLQDSEIYIEELVVQNSFHPQEEFKKVKVGKMLATMTEVHCLDDFLKAFGNDQVKSLEFQAVGTGRILCIDALRNLPWEKLILTTAGANQFREEHFEEKFQAKKWEIGEQWLGSTPPLLLQFVKKMVRENSAIGCTYYAEYDSPIDKEKLLAEIELEFSNSKFQIEKDLIDGGLLSIKLGVKELDVFEIPPIKLARNYWAYGVRMQWNGRIKNRQDMSTLDHLVEKSYKLVIFLVPKLARIPIFKSKPLAGFMDSLLSHPSLFFANLLFFIVSIFPISSLFFFPNFSLYFLIFLGFWIILWIICNLYLWNLIRKNIAFTAQYG